MRACGQPVTLVGLQSTLAWALGLNVGNVGFKPGKEISSGKPIVLFRPHGLGWQVRPIHIRDGRRFPLRCAAPGLGLLKTGPQRSPPEVLGGFWALRGENPRTSQCGPVTSGGLGVGWTNGHIAHEGTICASRCGSVTDLISVISPSWTVNVMTETGRPSRTISTPVRRGR